MTHLCLKFWLPVTLRFQGNESKQDDSHERQYEASTDSPPRVARQRVLREWEMERGGVSLFTL